MSKPKQPITLETAFTTYTVDELIGEGGAGRVCGGASAEGAPVAVKVLSAPSTDGREWCGLNHKKFSCALHSASANFRSRSL